MLAYANIAAPLNRIQKEGDQMDKQIDDQIIQDIQAALEAMFESIREEGKV